MDKKILGIGIGAFLTIGFLAIMGVAFAHQDFVDADNDGICDNAGNRGFVDADNDGICDNAANRGCRRCGRGI